MELTNREWSTLFWAVAVLVYAIWKAKPWTSLKSLLKAALNKHILVVFGSMGGYVSACVWMQSYLGLWSINNLKSTVIWTFGFAAVSLFQLKDVRDSEGHFVNIAKGSINMNIVITFVASTYVFSFPTEMILVPISGLASAMLVVAVDDPEHAVVRKILTAILVVIGTTYFFYAGYKASIDLERFLSTENIIEFLIPIALTLLYVPFLFAWHVFLSYEQMPHKLQWVIRDEFLNKYAQRQALVGFKWDTKGLLRWLRHVARFPPQGIDDVKVSIAEIQKSRRRDKKPFIVPPDDGWLPERAKQFLFDEGLVLGDYSRSSDGWYAKTPYVQLGARAADNNIAYYIEGDEFGVKSLRLVMNVNYPDDADSAIEVFKERVVKLINQSAYGEVGDIKSIALDANGESVEIGRISVSLKKQEWASKNNGYALMLDIVPVKKGASP